MIRCDKTSVQTDFDAGDYRGNFQVGNKYLNSLWFRSDETIWHEIESIIAVVVNEIVKTRIKEKINEEAYKKEYGGKEGIEKK
jgi:hypothetical protein